MNNAGDINKPVVNRKGDMMKTISHNFAIVLFMMAVFVSISSPSLADEKGEKKLEAIMDKVIPYGLKLGVSTCEDVAKKFDRIGKDMYGVEDKIKLFCEDKGDKKLYSVWFYTNRSFRKIGIGSNPNHNDVVSWLSKFVDKSMLEVDILAVVFVMDSVGKRLVFWDFGKDIMNVSYSYNSEAKNAEF